jgi:undecaprenyl-diphosphatase
MLLRRASFPLAAGILAAIWVGMLVWGGAEWAWDRQLLDQFHRSHDPGFIAWMKRLTDLGSWWVLTMVGVAGVAALAFNRRRRAALLLIILFGGRMLVELQKLVFGNERPPADGHLVVAESLAYPSAHAANSMITFVAIAALVPVVQSRRAVALVLAFLLAILIGLTRLVLGVHWPSDVFGGWAFGLLWIIICVRLASARPDPVPAETVAGGGTPLPPSRFPWRRRRKDERTGAQ